MDRAVQRVGPGDSSVVGLVDAVDPGRVPGLLVGRIDLDRRQAGVAEGQDRRRPLEAAGVVRRPQAHHWDVERAGRGPGPRGGQEQSESANGGRAEDRAHGSLLVLLGYRSEAVVTPLAGRAWQLADAS